MKKYLIFLLVLCLFLVGCGKNKSSNVKKDLIDNINNLKAYNLNGKLEVVNNDDVFNYDVLVNYKDKDFYRVSLKNASNNHEQIILRNDDGVYVVTPSLNKSFKFQSDWPNNNSQIYLIGSLVVSESKTVKAPKDRVADELRAIADSTKIEPNELAMAMAIYMLGFSTYNGFNEIIDGEHEGRILDRLYAYADKLNKQ